MLNNLLKTQKVRIPWKALVVSFSKKLNYIYACIHVLVGSTAGMVLSVISQSNLNKLRADLWKMEIYL